MAELEPNRAILLVLLEAKRWRCFFKSVLRVYQQVSDFSQFRVDYDKSSNVFDLMIRWKWQLFKVITTTKDMAPLRNFQEITASELSKIP